MVVSYFCDWFGNREVIYFLLVSCEQRASEKEAIWESCHFDEGPVCHSSIGLGLCVMPFQNGSSHIRFMELPSPNTENGRLNSWKEAQSLMMLLG